MDLWVFDNDGTLYDDSLAGEQFMKILIQYISRILNMHIGQVPNEIVRLKKKWDTDITIVALMKEYKLDFIKMVQDTYLQIKLEACSLPSPDMIRSRVLNSISSRKIVFTNNPSDFARYVVSYMGLADCFVDFIGIQETNFIGKPELEAYRTVEDRHRGFKRIILCDDSLKNLDVARKLGWETIWYNPTNINTELSNGHLVIRSFEELKLIK